MLLTCRGCKVTKSRRSVKGGREAAVHLTLDGTAGFCYFRLHGNPVLACYVHDNRDPKVIWHEAAGCWNMVLFLDAHRFAVFSSPDLAHWRYESEVSVPPLNECPDLFPLPGGKSDLWVLLAGADNHWEGSVAKYVIGSFDSKNFVPLGEPQPFDLGSDLYSLQTFANTPQGRRIFMGWRSCRFDGTGFHGMPFNGEFTLPCELFAYDTPQGPRLGRLPVREFLDNAPYEEEIFRENTAWEPLTHIGGEALLWTCDMTPTPDMVLTADFGGAQLSYDAAAQELSCLSKTVRVPLMGGRLSLTVVRDVVSLEVYAQSGRYPLNGYTAPHHGTSSIQMERGGALVHSLRLRRLRSIWALEHKG